MAELSSSIAGMSEATCRRMPWCSPVISSTRSLTSSGQRRRARREPDLRTLGRRSKEAAAADLVTFEEGREREPERVIGKDAPDGFDERVGDRLGAVLDRKIAGEGDQRGEPLGEDLGLVAR